MAGLHDKRRKGINAIKLTKENSHVLKADEDDLPTAGGWSSMIGGAALYSYEEGSVEAVGGRYKWKMAVGQIYLDCSHGVKSDGAASKATIEEMDSLEKHT